MTELIAGILTFGWRFFSELFRFRKSKKKKNALQLKLFKNAAEISDSDVVRNAYYLLAKSDTPNKDISWVGLTKKYFDSGKLTLAYQLINLGNDDLVNSESLSIPIDVWFLLVQYISLLDLYYLRIVCKKTCFVVRRQKQF